MEIKRTTIPACIFLIIGIVMCAFGLKLLFGRAQYAATEKVRVQVPHDICGQLMESDQSLKNEEFQREQIEYFQSQLDSGEDMFESVEKKLNLKEKWAWKSSNEARLRKSIRSRLSLAPAPGTDFIALTFRSDDPQEAARVVNAITEAYCDYWLRQRNVLAERGIHQLQQRFQQEETEILIQQNKVQQLRKKLGVQSSDLNTAPPEQEPYWEAKSKLDRAIEFHRLLAAKIEDEQRNLTIAWSPIQVIESAIPPKFADWGDCLLGVVCLVLGLFPLVGGLLLLKSGWYYAR